MRMRVSPTYIPHLRDHLAQGSGASDSMQAIVTHFRRVVLALGVVKHTAFPSMDSGTSDLLDDVA